MIEFKGLYYPPNGENALPVLVQFDGLRLHVWHLSNPFYHMISSDDFSIDFPNSGKSGTVKITKSIHIESYDVASIEAVMAGSPKLRNAKRTKTRKMSFLAIIASFSVSLLILWLFHCAGTP